MLGSGSEDEGNMVEINYQAAASRSARRTTLGLVCGALLIVGCSNEAGRSNSETVSFDLTSLTQALTASGPEGGPFESDGSGYELVNRSSKRSIGWTVETDAGWLVLSPDQGSLNPGDAATISATVNPDLATELTRGTHVAEVVLIDQSRSRRITMQFTLNVLSTNQAGALTVSPEVDVQLEGEVGSPLDTDDVTFGLTNAGGGPLSWSAAIDQSWIQRPTEWNGELDPGQAIDLTLVVDQTVVASLTPGIHRAHLVIDEVVNGVNRAVIERTVRLRLAPIQDGGRVQNGLVALYDFEGGEVDRVVDVSGVQPLLDLTIEDPIKVTRLPGALRVQEPTRLLSSGVAQKVTAACMASGELTIEAWVTPASLSQDGPARILTISDGALARNLTLGQGLWDGQPTDGFNVRLNTTDTDANGMPHVSTPAGAAHAGLQHVVYTRAQDGGVRMYVDNVLVVQSTVTGDFSSWSMDDRLALANEIGADRPWLGDLHLVAIYDRALAGSEVERNFLVGTGDPDVGALEVDPNTPFSLSVEQGGELPVSEKVYTVANSGSEGLAWSVTSSEPWVFTDLAGGTLASGEEAPCRVMLDQALIQTFSPGSYTATVAFRNDTSGLGSQSITVLLNVIGTPGGLSGLSDEAVQLALAGQMIWFDPDLSGGAHTWVFNGAEVGKALTSFVGDTRTDAALLQQIRHLLVPGKEPTATGGFQDQKQLGATLMFLLAKQTPRIWNQLDVTEKAKIETIVKACIVSAVFTSSDNSSSTVDMTGAHSWVHGNPNYRNGTVGQAIVGTLFLGRGPAIQMLTSYDHGQFRAELQSRGLPNLVRTYNSTDPNAPASGEVEAAVRQAYVYHGVPHSDLLGLYNDLTMFTYDRVVSCAANPGNVGILGNNGVWGGYMVSNCASLPNQGQVGMLREFDAQDGGGRRVSAHYANDGWYVNNYIHIALIAMGEWQDTPATQEVNRRMRVGTEDLLFKITPNLSGGYRNYQHGNGHSTPYVWNEDKGHTINSSISRDVLYVYHGL